jgi:hypothetical protein
MNVEATGSKICDHHTCLDLQTLQIKLKFIVWIYFL